MDRLFSMKEPEITPLIPEELSSKVRPTYALVSVAQWVGALSHNRMVEGSIPSQAHT